MSGVFDSIVRHPWRVLIIAAVLVIISLLLMSRLHPQTSLDAMLDPTDPATAAMGRVLEAYPVAEELLVMASLPEGEADASQLTAFAARLEASLGAEASLVRAVRYKPSDQARAFFEKVVAPAGLLYLEESQLADARERLTRESMRAQFDRNAAMLATPGPAAGAVAKAILQDPLRLHELLAERFARMLPANARMDGFFSPSGRDLLIRIEGLRPLSDLDFSARLVARAQMLAAEANTDGLTVHISGGYAIAAHNARLIRSDSISNSVSSVLTLGTLFVIMFRRPLWTFTLAFVPVAAGIIIGFGVYAAFNTTVTPLAMVIGGALGGIGIDYTVHMLSHKRADESPAQLAANMFRPLLAACVTSAIGFAVIGLSPVQILRDFALVGSLALTGAFLTSVTVLPAMLAIRDVQMLPRIPLARAAWKRPAVVLGWAMLVVIPMAVIAAGVDLTRRDTDMQGLHPQPNPPLEAQQLISERMGLSGASLLVYVTGDSADQVVERAGRMQTRLESTAGRDAGVVATVGPATFIPAPSKANQRRESFTEADVRQVIADFDATIAASDFQAKAYEPYRAILPNLLRPDSIPTLEDLRDYPDLANLVLPTHRDRHEALVHVMLQPESGTDAAAARRVNALIADEEGITLTGMSVLSERTDESVRRDLPRFTLLAVGCIAAYLALHYRSVGLALLANIPLVTSFILLLAVMRIGDISLNMVNMVMMPLLLGINVDFGIFAADSLRDRRMRERFPSSVRAMLTCLFTSVIGFGSLATVSIPAVASLGVLVAVGMIGCALGTIFVLWPAVLWIGAREER